MAPIARDIRGVTLFDGYLSPSAQSAMLDDLRQVVSKAPFFQPITPSGKPMSVRMSAAGRYGWVSDRKGYRYETQHPGGMPWPKIPASVLEVWEQVSGVSRAPECCLINFYGENTKMGLHQDKDEASFDWPVVSISLGDEALFRIGNVARGGKTESVRLRSGDVIVMGGAARLVHHGIDWIKFGTSPLMPKGGRINLTLRVVD